MTNSKYNDIPGIFPDHGYSYSLDIVFVYSIYLLVLCIFEVQAAEDKTPHEMSWLCYEHVCSAV